MSTTSSPPPAHTGTDQREVRIFSHSTLFYWWPVWVCGYVIAILTYFDGHRLAILPPNTSIDRVERKGEVLYELNPHGGTSEQLRLADQNPGATPFHLRVAQNSRLGAIFVVVLLLVILITSVPLRGLWSVVVIITVALSAIILALADLWDKIFESLGHLHIHANLAFYLFVSTGLLAMWLATVFFFDRQTYMVFTPGQLRVCLEIGGGETAYDTQGMSIQKHRDDMFRHWILGLGSGDLTVRTSGAQAHTFEMHNILNVSSKLKEIEDMQRERPTVQG
ncbi:MAG TPA: hypothetical protein VGF55_24980 [Gemmataceae bacterium]|jgi:hypothetical protein